MISLLKELIGPRPDQLRCCLHPNVGHHAKIKSTELMQTLPFLYQRIISIHQERVIELVTKLLLEWPQAGKVDNKAAGIKLCGSEMKQETAAVAVHKVTMTAVPPLAMATGVALKQFAAGMRRRR